MHAEHRIHMRVFEHARFDHRLGATGRKLLGRLEEQFDGAGELIAPVHQQLGDPDQHRGVGVVTAGMHGARNRRHVIDLVLFEDRKRVHIGPDQRDPLIAGFGTTDQRRDAGFGDAGLDILDSYRLQPFENVSCALVAIQPDLRNGVQVASVGDDPRHNFIDIGSQRIGHRAHRVETSSK